MVNLYSGWIVQLVNASFAWHTHFLLPHLIPISSALLTPVIGVVAVYVAWQQWKTNDIKLKLDLYDRRLKIYLKVKEFFDKILPESVRKKQAKGQKKV